MSGSFPSDDHIDFFSYHVANTAYVDIFTTSYGSSFVPGGFSPVLSLFDSTGAFQFDSQGYATDSDASLSFNSIGGEYYTIALTQYGNLAIGPNLLDGFSQQNTGNYTAEPPFNNSTPGGSFLMTGPNQRTSYWAVTFRSTEASLTVTPEPAAGILSLGGLALLAAWRARKRLPHKH